MLRFQRDPVAQTLEHLGLSAPAARRLAQAGTPLDIDAGVVLCAKGDRGSEAFLIVEGAATVDLGTRTIRIGPGDVVGELATLDPLARRNATVRTDSRCLVLVYDVQTFRSLAATDLRPILVPERQQTAA